MATSERRKTAADSSKLGQKDFVDRLAEAGEDALQRLTELPGGQRAVSAFNDLRSRVDDLNRKVRGLDELEARVAKLEKELAALKRSKPKSSATEPKSTKPIIP